MADTYFMNATFVNIAINLNSEIYENHPIMPMTVQNLNKGNNNIANSASNIKLQSWPAPISAFPNRGQFGTDGTSNQKNNLVIFSESSTQAKIYEIRSSTGTSLDLYFYLFGDTIYAVDQSGNSKGIKINQIEPGLELATRLLKSIPKPIF